MRRITGICPPVSSGPMRSWDSGAAIGLLKTGYLRASSSDDEDEDSPKFDEVDPKWARSSRMPIEHIAGGEPPWSVALWLTEVGLPKASNCTTNV